MKIFVFIQQKSLTLFSEVFSHDPLRVGFAKLASALPIVGEFYTKGYKQTLTPQSSENRTDLALSVAERIR